MNFGPKFQGDARFEVRRQLGEGGMGSVYEVIDHERGALVALKVLSRLSPTNVEQFKQEFRGLTGVVHPNLVRLHELVADGDRWFFTMDLVHGVPFIQYVRRDMAEAVLVPSAVSDDVVTREQAQVTIRGLGNVATTDLARGALDESRLRGALTHLARGVSAIHAAGKVHRDLKHSNVLVDHDGRAVILDFGLVTDAALRSDELAPGGVWGTPAYMAPEQAAGKVATAASDWYAIGVMLYESLTGRLPFSGKASEVLLAKQRAEPVPPSAWVQSVPSDLEQLALALLRFRPAERPNGDQVLTALGVGTRSLPPPTAVPTRPQFVGRGEELARLRAALAAASHEVPGGRRGARLASVDGISGIGKSALAEQVIAVLRDDCPDLLVLSARCYARETVPFKAFDGLIAALAQHLESFSAPELAAALPTGVSALTQMLPALLRVPALKPLVAAEPLPADPKELRRRAFQCLRGLLHSIASQRPVLLYVDDLQWGDEDSARLWLELLAEPDAPPLAWLCTFRSDEESTSPCLKLLFGADGLARQRVTRVSLKALSEDEIQSIAAAAVVGAGLGSDAGASIVREAGGNPYFAVELAREHASRPLTEAGIDQAPFTLEQALLQRVGRLTQPAQQLLRVVSVAGHPLDQKSAFRAAGLGLFGLSSLTELQHAHLVRLLGSEHHLVTTYHDRVRETVSQNLSVGAVRHVHRALVDALEQRGDTDPELLTEHLVGAGDLPRAARFAVLAAEQAARALAFGRAARLYQTALEHTTANNDEREAWKVALAEALVNAGRGADAGRVYLEAANSSSERAAELRRLGAEQLILSGHIDEGIAILGDVLRDCGLQLPEPGQALSWTMELAAKLRARGLAFEPRPSTELPADVLRRLEVCWAVSLGFTGSDPERLMPVVLHHLLDALDSRSAYHVLRALCLFIGNGAVATRPGSRTIAAALAVAEDLRARVDTPDTDGWVEVAKGMTAFLSNGDARAALPHFEAAQTTFRDRCRGAARGVGMADVGVLACLAEQGRLADYRACYPSYLKDADDRSDLYLSMYHRSYHAPPYYLAADDPDRAWAEVDAANRAWGRSGFDQCALFSLLSRLEILLYRGGPEAWRWANEHGPTFLGSILSTGYFFRARFFSLRGRAAVASVLAGVDVASALEQAHNDLAELRQNELRVAPALAGALNASVVAARGDTADTVGALDELVAGIEAAGGDAMLLACARLHRAQLQQDREQADAAREWLIAQDVSDPGRWAQMHIPVRR